MLLLLLRHLQSLLCTINQKRHVISHRHLTEGTGSLGGGTYSSEVYRRQAISHFPKQNLQFHNLQNKIL